MFLAMTVPGHLLFNKEVTFLVPSVTAVEHELKNSGQVWFMFRSDIVEHGTKN
jgi:hypothetical protein